MERLFKWIKPWLPRNRHQLLDTSYEAHSFVAHLHGFVMHGKEFLADHSPTTGAAAVVSAIILAVSCYRLIQTLIRIHRDNSKNGPS